MKILDALHDEAIIIGLKASRKVEVIQELATPVAELTGVDRELLVRVLMERERLGSTGIGGGIGIPHGKLKELDAPVLAFGLSHQGVDFESMDGRPTYIFFLLLTPDDSAGLHLKLLASISKLLKQEAIKEQLMKVKSTLDVIKIIKAAEVDI